MNRWSFVRRIQRWGGSKPHIGLALRLIFTLATRQSRSNSAHYFLKNKYFKKFIIYLIFINVSFIHINVFIKIC